VDKYVAQINEKLPSWAKKSSSKGTYYFHKVRYPGESLSVIAEWYTGDVGNWNYLTKANPKLDPDRITIGTTVLIPENLLHTKKAMPKEFVDAVAKRHKTRKAQASMAQPRSSYYYHKVKYPGESLSIIAKWYTGEVPRRTQNSSQTVSLLVTKSVFPTSSSTLRNQCPKALLLGLRRERNRNLPQPVHQIRNLRCMSCLGRSRSRTALYSVSGK
jgi:hypothetical protein